MIRPTTERIISIAAEIGLDLTADERATMPDHLQRQVEKFSALTEIDVDGVSPLFDAFCDGTDGR